MTTNQSNDLAHLQLKVAGNNPPITVPVYEVRGDLLIHPATNEKGQRMPGCYRISVKAGYCVPGLLLFSVARACETAEWLENEIKKIGMSWDEAVTSCTKDSDIRANLSKIVTEARKMFSAHP